MVPTSPTRPRRWITDEIARLDPERDWARIYQLMTAYRTNDFMLDLMYVHTFPHFLVAEHGPLPVWRGGAQENKVVQRASVRADDTGWHNMLWLYGPSDDRARRSLDTVNKIHAHHARQYPEAFRHYEDYVYVWCVSAALMHRLQQRMGLPGYTENEKIAAHRFWLETGKQFVVPGDDSGGHPVDGYPADFDGVLAWLEEFESRHWPLHETGRITVEAVIQQFEFRYVPRPLRRLVRAALCSFYPPSVLSAYGLTAPPRPVAALLRRAAGLALVLGGLGPDPTEHYMEIRERWTPQERRERARRRIEQDERFAEAFVRDNGVAAPGARCPVPHGNG